MDRVNLPRHKSGLRQEPERFRLEPVRGERAHPEPGAIDRAPEPGARGRAHPERLSLERASLSPPASSVPA